MKHSWLVPNTGISRGCIGDYRDAVLDGVYYISPSRQVEYRDQIRTWKVHTHGTDELEQLPTFSAETLEEVRVLVARALAGIGDETAAMILEAHGKDL